MNTQRNQGRRGKRSRWVRAQDQNHDDIVAWFNNRVQDENVSDDIKALSRGPDYSVRRFKGYIINGHKFHTVSCESKRKTQCSGVSLTSTTPSLSSSRDQNLVVGNVRYYGAVDDIIELDYFGHFKVVLFRCKWFHVEQDEYGSIRVNFSKLCYSNDPFVMANQVSQVFYVQDSKENHWHYAMETMPRDLFDINEDSTDDVGNTSWAEIVSDGVQSQTAIEDHNVNLLRDDLPITTVDVPTRMLDMQSEMEIDDSDDEIEDDTLWDFMHPSVE